MSTYLVAEAPADEALRHVLGVATSAIPAAAAAGVTLLQDGGRPVTAVYTDEVSPTIDEAQYTSGRGPCLDAWRCKETICVDDMDVAAEYPEFANAALAHSIVSTLSLPLVVRGEGTGALNLYARRRHAFSDDDVRTGCELAVAAAALHANATAYWKAFALSEGLSEAMKSRAVIEQAKGILMAESPRLDPDGAFDVLRRASQRENRKLREIAFRIVDHRGHKSVKEA